MAKPLPTGVRVSDAMTRKPIIVSPDMALGKCAKLMLDKGVGSVIVKESGSLEGIFTEKDLVRAIAQKKPTDTPLHKVMTKKIVTISPNRDIAEALAEMQDKEVRRLPVVHQGKLVGMLTQNDVLRIEPQLFEILVDKIQLREAKNKTRLFKGRCERCGGLAYLYKAKTLRVCETCKDLA